MSVSISIGENFSLSPSPRACTTSHDRIAVLGDLVLARELGIDEAIVLLDRELAALDASDSK